MEKISRKELLSVPAKDWKEEIRGVDCVWVIPSGRKHESGWAKMDFVATFNEREERIRFGGNCDDISFEGSHFRMDCDWPSRIIHIWNPRKFTVTSGISSISFVEENHERR